MLIILLILVAIEPWTREIKNTPVPAPEPVAVAREPVPTPLLTEEETVDIPAEPAPPVPEPIEPEPEVDNVVHESPAPESDEKTVLDGPVPMSMESTIVADEDLGIVIAEDALEAAATPVPDVSVPGEKLGQNGDLPEPQPEPPGDSEPSDTTPTIETETPVVEQLLSIESLEAPTPVPVPVEATSGGDVDPDLSETAVQSVPVVPQTLPTPVKAPAEPKKPGLFADVLAKIERQQSFEEAVIQVLDGYPERYLKAAFTGKLDYNSATGKASVIVEVTIDNEEYRAMALRLSEALKRFGHNSEQVSATMERPYDSYMEVRFRFSGRKKFRDLLLLCTRANDALTQSEWEFHSIPRSFIDAILSSMSTPLLTVELTDSSGQTVASASEKIAKPFVLTEERGFMLLPAFNGTRSEMTVTSVIPGRNYLVVKMEFELSMDELRRIADAVCTIKKGARLPEEFQYRFLK